MKDAHKYNQEYPKTVVLVKSGVFCKAFDDAALVLSAVTGYQVITQKNGHSRCGFNLQVTAQVKQLLIQNHVSYVELQTSTTNEQAEIIDAYDKGSPNVFDELKTKSLVIAKARQKSDGEVAAIRDGTDHEPLDSHREKARKFIDALCQGIHPLTGKPINNLKLNDPEIIRGLFLVRDKL